MKILSEAQGKDSYLFCYDDEKGTTFSFSGNLKENIWKIYFEYDTSKKIEFGYKKENLFFNIERFLKKYKDVINMNIALKGAISNLPEDIDEKFKFKVLSVKKINPKEEYDINGYVIFTKKRK